MEKIPFSYGDPAPSPRAVLLPVLLAGVPCVLRVLTAPGSYLILALSSLALALLPFLWHFKCFGWRTFPLFLHTTISQRPSSCRVSLSRTWNLLYLASLFLFTSSLIAVFCPEDQELLPASFNIIAVAPCIPSLYKYQCEYLKYGNLPMNEIFCRLCRHITACFKMSISWGVSLVSINLGHSNITLYENIDTIWYSFVT